MKKLLLSFAVAATLFSCETTQTPPDEKSVYAYDPIGDIVALTKQISIMKQSDAHTFLVNQGWVGYAGGYEQVYTKTLDCGGKCDFVVSNQSDIYASFYQIVIVDIPEMPVDYVKESIKSMGIEIEIRGAKQYYEEPESFENDVDEIGKRKYGYSDFYWTGEDRTHSSYIEIEYDTTTKNVTAILFQFYLPAMADDTLDVPYKFGFVEGECVVISADSVSQADFISQVAGSGWKWVSTNEIRLDGSVKGTGYWSGMLGAGPGAYFIDEDSVTKYYWFDALPGKCCHTDSIRFSNSVIEAYRQENWYDYMTLLEIKGNELWLMQIVGYLAAEDRNVYVLEKYQRMTDDELDFYRTNYTIER